MDRAAGVLCDMDKDQSARVVNLWVTGYVTWTRIKMHGFVTCKCMDKLHGQGWKCMDSGYVTWTRIKMHEWQTFGIMDMLHGQGWKCMDNG